MDFSGLSPGSPLTLEPPLVISNTLNIQGLDKILWTPIIIQVNKICLGQSEKTKVDYLLFIFSVFSTSTQWSDLSDFQEQQLKPV